MLNAVRGHHQGTRTPPGLPLGNANTTPRDRHHEELGKRHQGTPPGDTARSRVGEARRLAGASQATAAFRKPDVTNFAQSTEIILALAVCLLPFILAQAGRRVNRGLAFS
jgi:hypothetical protein